MSTETEQTLDTLFGGRVLLRQPASGYRTAIDPVLLAASVDGAAGPRALDLGCGVGAVSFCLLDRFPSMHVTGVEANIDLIELAKRNAIENGWADRFIAVSGSVDAPADPIPDGGFDLVVTNPPHLAADRAMRSNRQDKVSANVEGEGGLDAWIKAAVRALRHRGQLAMIHRADRLDDVLATLSGRFGGTTVHPLWPKANEAAKRVIVHATKQSNSPLKLSAGTVLHGPDGTYTDPVATALAGGRLEFGPGTS